MQHSADYGYPKHRQFHPHPSDTLVSAHGRARSLGRFSQDVSTPSSHLRREEPTAPSISIFPKKDKSPDINQIGTINKGRTNSKSLTSNLHELLEGTDDQSISPADPLLSHTTKQSPKDTSNEKKKRETGPTSSPLSLCHIRPPALPIPGPFTVLLQPFLFLGQILMLIDEDHSWLFVRILDSETEKRKD